MKQLGSAYTFTSQRAPYAKEPNTLHEEAAKDCRAHLEISELADRPRSVPKYCRVDAHKHERKDGSISVQVVSPACPFSLWEPHFSPLQHTLKVFNRKGYMRKQWRDAGGWGELRDMPIKLLLP